MAMRVNAWHSGTFEVGAKMWLRRLFQRLRAGAKLAPVKRRIQVSLRPLGPLHLPRRPPKSAQTDVKSRP
jgi:hypothetical protein